MKRAVVYFSVYSTTKQVAEEIASRVGADLLEIKPEHAYDANRKHYSQLAAEAKKEHDEDMRPAIANSLSLDEYDEIFIGYPMWWYTFPMIIYTFFDQYDLSGKTIIPFNLHMGSGDGGTYATIRELNPKAELREGLPLDMRDVEKNNVDRQITSWLARVV